MNIGIAKDAVRNPSKKSSHKENSLEKEKRVLNCSVISNFLSNNEYQAIFFLQMNKTQSYKRQEFVENYDHSNPGTIPLAI